MLSRALGTTLTAVALAGCAAPTLKEPSTGHLRTESVATTPGIIPPPVQQAISLPKPRPTAKTETYSVVVNNVKVHDLLFALARDAKLNVDIHPDINGYVTLNALDQTLQQLLSRIAKQVDMRFEMDGPNLAVMPDTPFLKTYRVDYVNISRDVTGTASTNTQITTSAVSGGGSSGGNSSIVKIVNTSKNHFWASLEKNIKDILQDTDKERIISRRSAETMESASRASNNNTSTAGTGAIAAAKTLLGSAVAGKGNQSAESQSAANAQEQQQKDLKDYEIIYAASVIANAETGIISVRASSRQHEKVQEFIDRVMGSARRQVLIEATIVEVELSDGYQQGIDWGRIRADNSGFTITKPTLASNVGTSVTPFALTLNTVKNPLSIVAAVDLLQSFGNLKVLSSPKLSVLNNQTATLKVAEEFVYFNVKADVTPATTTSPAITAYTTTPQSVSVGFFMSVTPQISEGDTVTLNVRPSISSISELKRDPHPSLTIENYIPQIRTREMESMLRIESGGIAVLGGLMEDRMDNKSGRVPLIGAIPLFGELLNNRANSSKKSELVIFLRPTVIKDAGDYSKTNASLPGKEFFSPSPVFQPFSLPILTDGGTQ